MEGLQLIRSSKRDPNLNRIMARHYSDPRGFVGRSLCYGVFYGWDYYGAIVGGSATKHLPGRNEYLGIDLSQLNSVINNIFFHVEPLNGKYPLRNFTTRIVKIFLEIAADEWTEKYGDPVIGFETLIEKPRTGELYRRAGFVEVGETKGFTCKRTAGQGTDSWSRKRVWNTNPDELRPKLVLALKLPRDKDK